MKKALAFVIAVTTLAAVPAAAAHVTANPGKAEAGSFAMIVFRVPHGCEESPTTSITIRLPDGIISVAPQAVPGWRATTKEGKFAEPVTAFGETHTEGVKQITWTGGPLDPHQFTDFGVSMRLPDKPGETLWFPTVQRCEQGVHRWIQIPVAGEPEPDEPAPSVVLEAAAAEEPVAEEPAMTEEPESDEDEMGGAEMAALGMGAGGLLAGLAALGIVLRSRPT